MANKIGDPKPPECSDFVVVDLFEMIGVTGTLRNREWDLGPRSAAIMSEASGRAIREAFDFSAPTTIDADWGTLAVNDTNSAPDIQDAQIIEGFIVVEEAIQLRWASASAGYFAIEVGRCCGKMQLVFEGASIENTVNPTPVISLEPGIHSIRMWNIDDWVNTARNINYSLDGGVTWVSDNIPPGIQLSRTKPTEPTKCVKVCKDTGRFFDLYTGDLVDPDSCKKDRLGCEANELDGLVGPAACANTDDGSVPGSSGATACGGRPNLTADIITLADGSAGPVNGSLSSFPDAPYFRVCGNEPWGDTAIKLNQTGTSTEVCVEIDSIQNTNFGIGFALIDNATNMALPITSSGDWTALGGYIADTSTGTNGVHTIKFDTSAVADLSTLVLVAYGVGGAKEGADECDEFEVLQIIPAPGTKEDVLQVGDACLYKAVSALNDTLDSLKTTKDTSIEDADYNSVLRYIFGRPAASQPWLLHNAAGVLLFEGADLGEFQADVESKGYAEWNGAGELNEQHFICPCPPGGPFKLTTGDPAITEEIDCITIAEAGPIPEKAANQILCALRTQDCNSDALISLQQDANEMASDSLIKSCLLNDFFLNCADDTPLTETLDKETNTLSLEGNVAEFYTAGTTIALKDALGNVCGEATAVKAGYDEQNNTTTVAIEECELSEGKEPVAIKTAKPVLTATVGAVKAVVKNVTILQAKAIVKATKHTAVKEPVRG